ncbi:MAG: ribosome small subunit-dependent GTPase A [Bacilli bacterium]|nr:ribosome small subunit-dependent GTPase A [Bacilli bacterium]
MQGRIIKLLSDLYTVETKDNIYECKARGVFRNNKITPLVGDLVVIDIDKKIINEIKERNNSLVRPPLANIDQVMIITSVKKPDFSANLLDKMISMLEYNNITPIICFTKMDLLNKEEKKDIKNIIKYYKKIGYKIFFNTEIRKIKKVFKNKLTVFAGQSGAGKSTLLNKLDKNLKLKTGEISNALNRGKHTTRHVELFNLFKGLVADTPGFSSFDLKEIPKDELSNTFVEIKKHGENCEYKNCSHINEKECYVKKLVNENKILESRYENYKRFVKEGE